MKLVVIADDLSGAAEVAGIAYSLGLSAEVQRAWQPATGAAVVVVDADTRSASDAATAAKRTAEIVRQIASSGPCCLFKKVDSLLRGWPRAEIEAILRVTGQLRALLAPANPSRGRTIVSGRYLVGGVPLDQTPFAADPEHPRLTAEVGEMLGPGCFAMSLPNAATLGELDCLAAELEPDTLPAGAADFFAAWLRRQSLPPTKQEARSFLAAIQLPALFVCGSRGTSAARIDQARSRRIPVCLLDPSDATGTAQGAAAILKRESRVLLAIAHQPLTHSPTELSARLAQAVQDVLGETAVATLLVEGGATAGAVVGRLGWSRLAIDAEAPAGIGVLRPLAIENAPRLMIKPGSYAWPESIW